MKVAQLKRAIQVLGDIKLSEAIKFYDRPHECPKCKGDGVLQIRYNAYPNGLPDSGWVEDWKIKTIDCDVCEGHGYTKKEMKPIVKTEVLGYE